MSSPQPTVVTLQVSGVAVSDQSPLPPMRQAQVFIVECSPHGHMLIVKGLAVSRALGDPEEDVVYTSIINNNLQVVLDVSARGVDVHLGQMPKDAFNPFRLTLAEETDFWRFCGAFGEAKVTHIHYAEKLLKAYEEAVVAVVKQLKAEFATA